MHNKKIVAFNKSGVAELINGISGCAIYEEYDASKVLESIDKVSSEKLNKKDYSRVKDRICIENYYLELKKFIDKT